ncbi:SusD/RagB family nutrient-binding outer membrane lipoprotein [Parabacteroides pacaensis]|uniref:SusD/RagB family nutrient-binding outer membrane lipoprotein n=1 Tax=Parabacteroides pacaensis TaxID=2086575 RepID=UPI000D0F4610|nr:SusD/RagB family nutrient-binding outer membrane lipoprotein [Parabacteroides pacaensis]
MKPSILKIGLTYLLLICLFGCTSDFEKMNKNPFETTHIIPGYLIRNVLQQGLVNMGIWEYQVGDNLHVHFYAQYFASVNSGFVTDRYGWKSSWIHDGFWYSYYSNTTRIRHEVGDWAKEHPEWDNMYQILRICDAMCAARTTDMFGDVPYSEAGQGIPIPKFDSQKDIYYTLFTELKEAVAALKSNTNQESYTELQDIYYKGDVNKWIKLANSLRLRLALRISFIDPEKAKQEGEAALTDVMMESNADNAGALVSLIENSNGHPLYYIGNWDDFRASKTIIDILQKESSVADPRLPLWFGKTQGYVAGTFDHEYHGVPNGLLASQMTEENNKALNNSAVWGFYFNKEWNLQKKGDLEGTDGRPTQEGVYKPLVCMNYAEVCLLKAEAALRGWAGAGDAQTQYEKGIRASFAEFREGVDANLYTTENDDLYIHSGNVKWDPSANFETKLKKVITQKWLALYPNGAEAWSEFRRTGYPVLNPVQASDISVITEGQFIKKVPYTDQEISSNPNALDPSLNQGQGNGQNVRVWWDTGRYK